VKHAYCLTVAYAMHINGKFISDSGLKDLSRKSS